MFSAPFSCFLRCTLQLLTFQMTNMDQINFKSVGKAFLNLIEQRYIEIDEEVSDCHYELAQVLLEKLEETTNEYVFVEENINDIGGIMVNEEYPDEERSGRKVTSDSIPLSKKQKFVDDYSQNSSKWSFSTYQKRHKLLKHPSYINRWISHVAQGGSNWEIYNAIENHVVEAFREARSAFLPVHDLDLRKWALQKSIDFPGFKFKASEDWILSLKQRNGISSRKIQKFVSKRCIRNRDLIRQNALTFSNEMQEILPKYDPKNVWNTDQTGFKYEILSSRTLSHKGEKSTLGASFSPKNKATHSYTAQYLISMRGDIVGKLFVCLQEKANEFGPIVQNNLFEAPNLIIKCSRSGKLTRNLVECFLDEAVKPNAHGEVLYILDRWTGQLDEDLYSTRFQTEEVNMMVKFIPENCTDIVQPLDTYFHRQLKYLVRKFYEYELLSGGNDTGYSLTSRNGILKLQSLVHFLLSAPAFRPMIQHCWVTSTLFVGQKPEFRNVKSVCFDFTTAKCELRDCVQNAFVRCSWCMKCICFSEFFNDYHLKMCNDSPYADK